MLVWARMAGADFDDKTLEFRVEGDMPRVACGRYAIVEAARFQTVVMQADLWRRAQKAKQDG